MVQVVILTVSVSGGTGAGGVHVLPLHAEVHGWPALPQDSHRQRAHWPDLRGAAQACEYNTTRYSRGRSSMWVIRPPAVDNSLYSISLCETLGQRSCELAILLFCPCLTGKCILQYRFHQLPVDQSPSQDLSKFFPWKLEFFHHTPNTNLLSLVVKVYKTGYSTFQLLRLQIVIKLQVCCQEYPSLIISCELW